MIFVPSKQSPEEDDADSKEGDHDENMEDSDEELLPIPLGMCLFCTQALISVDVSIHHMTKKHGFFIPCKYAIYTASLTLTQTNAHTHTRTMRAVREQREKL